MSLETLNEYMWAICKHALPHLEWNRRLGRCRTCPKKRVRYIDFIDIDTLLREGYSVRRTTMLLRPRVIFGLAASVFMLGGSCALAVSPSQEECEASGGIYSHEGGQAICIT